VAEAASSQTGACPTSIRVVMECAPTGRPRPARRRYVPKVAARRPGVERLDTVSYGQLWESVRPSAPRSAPSPSSAGDRIPSFGFTSVDYAVIDIVTRALGRSPSSCRPEPRNSQLQPILGETEPAVIASSSDLSRTTPSNSSHGPAAGKLVDSIRPEVDDQREAVRGQARARRRPSSETLADVLTRLQA